MRRHRPPAILILVLSTACLLSVGTGSALALFSGTETVGASSCSAGFWVYYLHNNPTPPTADTTAQYNLTMTTTASTTAVLYTYDTDGANRPGRGITRQNPPSPGLLTALRYVNWRTPALSSALSLNGTVTVDIWSATDTAAPRRTGSLIVYLRDYNPGSDTYAEIANATYTGDYAVGRAYYWTPISVTVTPTYSVPAGHILEAKIEAPRATSQNDMLVAYDTTTYPSTLRVR